MRFEGHLKAINMLSDSLERRVNTSLKASTSSACSRWKKPGPHRESAHLEQRAFGADEGVVRKLGFNGDQIDILDDLIIENRQCRERAEIHTQVLANLVGTRASIVGHNLNQLIKKFTIWSVALMLISLVVVRTLG